MNANTILSLIGAVLAILAIVLVFIFRDFQREKVIGTIETQLKSFNQSAYDNLSKTSTIIQELQGIRSASQSLCPDFSIFLATQWKFIEKTVHYRLEKHEIARKIVTKYISDHMSVLLDSGSTTDLVTSELLRNRVNGLHIYSNNVYAAMHLSGTSKVPFYLLPGSFSQLFAAVYSPEANRQIGQTGFNLFILATTALRFDSGIMVHISDDENYEFKRTALLTFFHNTESKLLIAADASKFFEPVETYRGVVSTKEWNDILSRAASRIVIVTSPPSSEFSTQQLVLLQNEIAKFRSVGILVDDAS
jgi:DeoR/GlpR family transcriptional regulator of sugar metabolism